MSTIAKKNVTISYALKMKKYPDAFDRDDLK